jgi:hypothetical protein
MESQFGEMAAEIYRERVMRARQTPPIDKLFDGARIFDRVCGVMRDGIRGQFPDSDDSTVEALLHERLEMSRRLEVLCVE